MVAHGRALTLGLALWGTLLATQPSWGQVTIKREAVTLRNPKDFNVPLRTRPARQIDLTCPQNGYVRLVNVKVGEKASARGEAVRMDDTVAKLELDRAKANYQAAKIELKIAEGKKDAAQQELAQAHLDSAQAGLKLAEFSLEQLAIRVPFAGEVFRVLVAPGQFVRAGEPLVTIAETTSLAVEVPADRTQLKAGAEIDLMVEQTAIKSKVQVVLPPIPQFESLRDMVSSLATAVVQIENPRGEFHAGQSVYTTLVPQHPFTPVPTTAIKAGTQENGNEGKRYVQVLRQGVVRDISIQPLTQVGENRIFVAGAFALGDEVIVESSQPLKDGQQVRPQTGGAAATAETPPAAAAPAATGGF